MPPTLRATSLALLVVGAAACADDPATTTPVPAPLPEAVVRATSEGGLPTLVTGYLGERAAADAPDVVAAAIAPTFAIAPRELRLASTTPDELGHRHHRFDRAIEGVPVIGAQLVVHEDADGRIYAANADPAWIEDVDTTPSLTADDARAIARDADAQLDDATAEAPELVVLAIRERGHLAYRVRVAGERAGDPVLDDVFVDALDGAVLDRHPQLHLAINRQVWDANDTTTLPATPARTEGQPDTNWLSVDGVYENLGHAYACYWTAFGRDSYDGAGSPLKAYVRWDKNWNNAKNGVDGLYFGSGDGIEYRDLARDYDVVVHELSHAVTNTTAKLIYKDESGALNEATSDIMAAYCSARRYGLSQDTWRLGEWSFTPATDDDEKRRMDAPATRNGKDWYPERQRGGGDDGGVHFNSGIANLAFYLMSMGGTHPRGMSSVRVHGIGIDAAAKTWYRALTVYMTPSTTIRQARMLTAQAANDLYGIYAHDAVHGAWEAVGVRPPSAPGVSRARDCRTAPRQAGRRFGRSDVTAAWRDGTWTALSVFASLGGSFAAPLDWERHEGGWIADARFAAGDFNGDGTDDLVVIWPHEGQNVLSVRISTGGDFLYHEHWTQGGGTWSPTTQWLPGDFDGDGDDDMVAAWNDGWMTSVAFYESTEDGFLVHAPWATRDGGWSDSARWSVGYVDDDWRADLITAWDDDGWTTLTVRLARASGGFEPGKHWSTRRSSWNESARLLVGDFDGVGYDDVAIAWNEGGAASILVWKSFGWGFLAPEPWATRDGGWGDNVAWFAGDFDGFYGDDVGTAWNNGTAVLTVRAGIYGGGGFTTSGWRLDAGTWQDDTVYCAGRFTDD